MFDPIVGPPDQHSGPAIGHTTEKGDTWHAAVGKINASFEKVWHALSGGASVAVEAVDDKAREAFNALRTAHDQLVHDYGNLVMRLEHIEGVLSDYAFKVDALERHVGTLPTAVPAPNDGNALDPEGKPASGADPQATLDAVAAALSASA